MSNGDSSPYTFPVGNPIVRSVREKEPSHLKFEIESFNALHDSTTRTGSPKIESVEFNSGGQSWVLVIYLDGNAKDGESDNISLYLRLVNKPAGGESVNASFTFFIFDKVREKYISIQDARQRRFEAAHLEWGISQALPIAAFHDEKNGLLINDSCTFGAEVHVITNAATVARLSRIEEETIRSYTWSLHNFSKLGTDTYSPAFSIEERSWKLRLYPTGNLTGQDKYLSLYLYLDDRADLTGGRKLYVDFELSIEDQLTGDYYKKTVGFWFDSSNDQGGYDDFISLADLNNQEKGYKENDTLMIKVTFNEIFLLTEIN